MFDCEQAQEIYMLIHQWLTTKSVGGYSNKSDFKIFQKKLWDPILKSINDLSTKKNLTDEEKEFLKSTVYSGYIFRVLKYKPRDKKYVFQMDEYQSWSKSIEGISNIPGIHGEILLLIGESDIGIDIFGLLCFLVKYEYIQNPGGFVDFKRILKYEQEYEVVYKISFNKIEKIVVVDSKHLVNYKENIIREIPKSLWGRNKMH